MSGILYLVSTPIGNLGDVSSRAIETFKHVAVIASEDTRRTMKLLNHCGIATRLTSYHDHSSPHKREQLVERLSEGESIALVSDAGTPLVNDPGYKLVRACIDADIEVTAVPGPSSTINALVLSGLPSDAFQFLGYLAVKSGKKVKELTAIKESPITSIILESPHRIVKTLGVMTDVLTDRPIAVCREMTKMHEEVFRGTSAEAHDHFLQKTPKGEFTVVIAGSKCKERLISSAKSLE